ncbi:MAG: acyl carrier protein, partial [Gammaproteobacteria bacterium]
MTNNSMLQTTTLAAVQRIFADVTRYPRELLEPNADLEEDLGIDSVKLGEILAVLREHFNLESRLSDDISEIRSIAAIAALLEGRLGQPQAIPATAPLTVAPPLPVLSDQRDLLTQVTKVVAEVTRYPIELLTPNADLEEDLGIDSVKLGEILAVLREHFGLESRLSDDISEIRSIAAIAALLEGRL